MIAIPFVYFTFLSFIFYRKQGHKIDLSVVITAMFAVSGLFSILIDVFGLRNRDTLHYHISLEAAFAYCALLTLCVLPFALNSHLRMSIPKPSRNPVIIKLFAFLSMLWLVLIVVFSSGAFLQMLTSDMGESRSMVVAGELESWLDNVPASLRLLIIILNMFFSCSWVLLFLAFYSRYVQHLHPAYFWVYILASLSGPYNAVLGADRSGVVYWILMSYGIYLLFRPFISKSEKKQLAKGNILILSLLIVYLVMMTIGRFMESTDYGEKSTQGSLIYYCGISYINFCNFFDNYTPPYTNLGVIFPFIGKYVFGITTGGIAIQQRMTLLTNFECGTFYTFIGHIIMGAGTFVAICFCLFHSLISFVSLPSVTKKPVMHNIYLYFALASVIYLGLFGYYYSSPYKSFSLIFFFFMLKLSK